jgi:hypothetical protein
MKKEDLELLRRMRAAGVPLELNDDDRAGTCPPAIGLSIEWNAVGIAQEIGTISTGYIVDMYIVPNLPWPVEIRSAVLDLPWADPHFQWICDPAENGAKYGMYWLPGTDLGYSRDRIINHIIGSGKALTRGRSLSGILLGHGMRMPESVSHGNEVPAFLRVFDQFGREFSAAMPLRADRLSSKSQTRKSKRKPLFSCPDLR